MDRMPFDIHVKQLDSNTIEIRYDISGNSSYQRADNDVQNDLKNLGCELEVKRNGIRYIKVPKKNFEDVRKFLLENGVNEVCNDSVCYSGPRGETCFPKLKDLKIADLKNMY